MSKERAFLLSELERSSVPKNYRHLHATAWMINAYNLGKGTTYHELINLYEAEQMTVRQQEQLKQLQLKYEQQQYETMLANKRAKEAEKKAKDAEDLKNAALWYKSMH